MRRSEIKDFLRSVHAVKRLAEKVSISLLVKDNSAFSPIVSYECLDGSTDLSVELLNVSVEARLEYVKYLPKPNVPPVVSGQFSFFRKFSDKEELRLKTVVRIVGQDHVVLPDDNVIFVDGQNEIDEADQLSIREAVSTSLLAEIIEAMPSWTHD